MRTDLQDTVKELIRNVPVEKKAQALETFLAHYNSFPSCKYLIGTEQYAIKMDEKLSHAYEVAIRS